VSNCGLQTVLAETFQASLRYSARQRAGKSKPEERRQHMSKVVLQNIPQLICHSGEGRNPIRVEGLVAVTLVSSDHDDAIRSASNDDACICNEKISNSSSIDLFVQNHAVIFYDEPD